MNEWLAGPTGLILDRSVTDPSRLRTLKLNPPTTYSMIYLEILPQPKRYRCAPQIRLIQANENIQQLIFRKKWMNAGARSDAIAPGLTYSQLVLVCYSSVTPIWMFQSKPRSRRWTFFFFFLSMTSALFRRRRLWFCWIRFSRAVSNTQFKEGARTSFHLTKLLQGNIDSPML